MVAGEGQVNNRHANKVMKRMPSCRLLVTLEDTARYAGLLLAPAEGFDLGFFLPKSLCCFGPFLEIFGVQ